MLPEKLAMPAKLIQYFSFKNEISSPFINRDRKKMLQITIPIMHTKTLYFTQHKQNFKKIFKENIAYSENKQTNS